MNLDALFNNLLTSGIGLSNSETLRKLRILNTFHLVVIMTAPLLGLFYFYVGALILFYVTILTGLLMISSLLLLRKTRSLVLGGHYAISILWAFLFLVSWNTGAITYEGVIHPTWILKESDPARGSAHGLSPWEYLDHDHVPAGGDDCLPLSASIPVPEPVADGNDGPLSSGHFYDRVVDPGVVGFLV
jgi:hypothetical protein